LDAQIHIFVTWAVSHLSRPPPEKDPPVTNWIGGLVDLGTNLDDVEKRKISTLQGLLNEPLSRPACSHSLY
jgi:hypothetical protein